MRTSFFRNILFISTLTTAFGWRSLTTGGSALLGSDRLSHREKGSSRSGGGGGSEQLNIGLIAPHTNFGKRQYSQAITKALADLQKMRDTKLGFLQNYEFKAANIHFDMMQLTPSPTSESLSG